MAVLSLCKLDLDNAVVGQTSIPTELQLSRSILYLGTNRRFMKDTLQQLSIAAIRLADVDFDQSQQDSRWLGTIGASAEAIKNLENRLDVELPEDYKEFLSITDGFAAATGTEPHFFHASDVDYLSKLDEDLIHIWRETGNPEVADQLARSLCVGGDGEQYFLIIPPESADEDWQYWKFAHWIPGEEPYENLVTYFEDVAIFTYDLLDERKSAREAICEKYIEYLSVGKLAELLDLFADDSMITSPLYGRQSATKFYNALFADTEKSVLEPRGTFYDDERGEIALYFTYQWSLKNGEVVEFDVVDIISFTLENKIASLKIIYDTVDSRDKLNKS